ncbi:MAG: GAF domain-containing protein [Frankiaceae bacterium]
MEHRRAEWWRESVDVHDEREKDREPRERSRLPVTLPLQPDDLLATPPGAPGALLDQLSTLTDPELLRLPLPHLLDQTLDRLLRIVHADVAAVFLAASTATSAPAAATSAAAATPAVAPLRLAAARGVGGPGGAALAFEAASGIAQRVVALAEPLLVEPGDPLDAGLGTALGVPLLAGAHVLGAVVVGVGGDGTLGVRDIPVLSLAATHVALALDHGVLLDAERRARRVAEAAGQRLDRLQRLTASLAGALTEADVVTTVVSGGLELLGAVAGAVWTLHGDRLRLAGSTGYPPRITDRLADVPLDAPYPTAVAAKERRPVLVHSLAERDAGYPGLRDEPAVGEAFGALPLMLGGSLLGVLSASFPDGERFDQPADVEFLEAVAGQCAVAMHRVSVIAAEREARRLEQAAVRRLGRLQAFTSALSSASNSSEVADVTVAALVGEIGADRCVLAVLDDQRDALTLVRASGVDADHLERFATIPLDHHLPAADAVLRGTPIVIRSLAERDRRYPLLAGVPPQHDHTLLVLPLLVEDDPIGSISLSFHDGREVEDDDLGFLLALAGQCAQAIERSRLREGQRRSRRQLSLLAETGRLFATSLDLDAPLEQVCRLLAPAMVDAVTARVIDADGQLRVAAYALADSDVEAPLRRLWKRGGAAYERRLRAVIESGEPVIEPVPDLASLPDDIDPVIRTDLETLDLRSSVLLPLRARGRAVGLISTATRSGRPPLAEADLPFLTELAARVALAVDNGRLFRHQAEIAHTLQRSLLPAELPPVDGAEVAVSYLPGMEGTTVGGDFYDVIPLPSGRMGLVIGDVMGRGVRAAAVMGQLRAAVRSYALEGHAPAALLARLDRLVTTLEDGLLVTCVYGEWDPQRSLVTLSCAGHLPPLVRLPGQRPHYLEIDPGLPLGVGGLAASDIDVDLPPGSLLLAYTDGLVEAPDLPLQDGMAELADLVGAAPLVASEICRLAVERVRPSGHRPWGAQAAEGHRHDDDIALLALVVLDGPDGRTTAMHRAPDGAYVELPADTGSPAVARQAVAGALSRWGVNALTDTAVLLVSELVTNAVRHAGTALRLAVLRPSPGRVRIEVTDHAPHAPLRPLAVETSAEGGRGLFLVQALAAGWGSEITGTGKTVWFELDELG